MKSLQDWNSLIKRQTGLELLMLECWNVKLGQVIVSLFICCGSGKKGAMASSRLSQEKFEDEDVALCTQYLLETYINRENAYKTVKHANNQTIKYRVHMYNTCASIYSQPHNLSPTQLFYYI